MSYVIPADYLSGNIQFKRKRNRERRLKQHHYLVDSPPDTARDEKLLWRAVIIQAITDAVARNRKQQFRYYKMEAIRWFSHDSVDFQDVCHRADLDPSYVRVCAKKALMNPARWRTDLGHSQRYEERREMRAIKKKRRRARRIRQQPQGHQGCMIYNLFA